MLDVAAGNKYSQSDQCEWTSSQSSVSGGGGGGKQEQQQSSTSLHNSNNNNGSVLKEHDYIGMNEVSSTFKGPAPPASHLVLNLQETELRLGPAKQRKINGTSLGDVTPGASFQPKPDLGSTLSGTVAPSSVAYVTKSEQPSPKPLDLGIALSNKNTPPYVSGEEGAVKEDNNTKVANNIPSKSGSKRVFAEAIGGEDPSFNETRPGFGMMNKLSSDGTFPQLSKHPLLPPLYPWKAPKQQQYLSPKLNKVDGPGAEPAKDDDEVEAARAPVGWPPVQSFRKTTLAVPQSSKKQQPDSQKSVPPAQQSVVDPVSPFVKVYMDGVSIGRKVEIKYDDSYEKLVSMLEEMFQYHITGQNSTAEKPKLNFLTDSEYVLTYEDKDGDLMLVGDVPWKMFVGSVKRLRIMKGTDAIGLGPRPTEVA